MKRFSVLPVLLALAGLAPLAHADKAACLAACKATADQAVITCTNQCGGDPGCAIQCRAQWWPVFSGCAAANCGVVVVGNAGGGVGTYTLNMNSNGGTYYLTGYAAGVTLTVKLGNTTLASGAGFAPTALVLPAGNQSLTVTCGGSIGPDPLPSRWGLVGIVQ